MTLFQLLTALDAQSGGLTVLFRAGIITYRAYTAYQLYQDYEAVLQLPQFIDAPSGAVDYIAQRRGVHRATVYRAVKECRGEVQ